MLAMLAMLAGGTTCVAGLLFLVELVDRFVPAVYVLIGWLCTRSFVLSLGGLAARGSLRLWTLLSAATDLAMAGILLVGLAVTTFSIALFGPPPEMTMSFAAVLALSFVVTGAYLIEVAGTEE